MYVVRSSSSSSSLGPVHTTSYNWENVEGGIKNAHKQTYLYITHYCGGGGIFILLDSHDIFNMTTGTYGTRASKQASFEIAHLVVLVIMVLS